MVYVAPVCLWYFYVLQVTSAEFVMPIVVSNRLVSLLEMMEEPPLELVPHLKVLQ